MLHDVYQWHDVKCNFEEQLKFHHIACTRTVYNILSRNSSLMIFFPKIFPLPNKRAVLVYYSVYSLSHNHKIQGEWRRDTV